MSLDRISYRSSFATDAHLRFLETNGSALSVAEAKVLTAKDLGLEKEFARRIDLLLLLVTPDGSHRPLEEDDELILPGSSLIVQRTLWKPVEDVKHEAEHYVSNWIQGSETLAEAAAAAATDSKDSNNKSLASFTKDGDQSALGVPLPARFKCAVCGGLLRQAMTVRCVTASCAAAVCKCCAESLLKESTPALCPVCGSAVRNFISNKALIGIISNLNLGDYILPKRKEKQSNAAIAPLPLTVVESPAFMVFISPAHVPILHEKHFLLIPCANHELVDEIRHSSLPVTLMIFASGGAGTSLLTPGFLNVQELLVDSVDAAQPPAQVRRPDSNAAVKLVNTPAGELSAMRSLWFQKMGDSKLDPADDTMSTGISDLEQEGYVICRCQWKLRFDSVVLLPGKAQPIAGVWAGSKRIFTSSDKSFRSTRLSSAHKQGITARLTQEAVYSRALVGTRSSHSNAPPAHDTPNQSVARPSSAKPAVVSGFVFDPASNAWTGSSINVSNPSASSLAGLIRASLPSRSKFSQLLMTGGSDSDWTISNPLLPLIASLPRLSPGAFRVLSHLQEMSLRNLGQQKDLPNLALLQGFCNIKSESFEPSAIAISNPNPVLPKKDKTVLRPPAPHTPLVRPLPLTQQPMLVPPEHSMATMSRRPPRPSWGGPGWVECKTQPGSRRIHWENMVAARMSHRPMSAIQSEAPAPYHRPMVPVYTAGPPPRMPEEHWLIRPPLRPSITNFVRPPLEQVIPYPQTQHFIPTNHNPPYRSSQANEHLPPLDMADFYSGIQNRKASEEGHQSKINVTSRRDTSPNRPHAPRSDHRGWHDSAKSDTPTDVTTRHNSATRLPSSTHLPTEERRQQITRHDADYRYDMNPRQGAVSRHASRKDDNDDLKRHETDARAQPSLTRDSLPKHESNKRHQTDSLSEITMRYRNGHQHRDGKVFRVEVDAQTESNSRRSHKRKKSLDSSSGDDYHGVDQSGRHQMDFRKPLRQHQFPTANNGRHISSLSASDELKREGGEPPPRFTPTSSGSGWLTDTNKRLARQQRFGTVPTGSSPEHTSSRQYLIFDEFRRAGMRQAAVDPTSRGRSLSPGSGRGEKSERPLRPIEERSRHHEEFSLASCPEGRTVDRRHHQIASYERATECRQRSSGQRELGGQHDSMPPIRCIPTRIELAGSKVAASHGRQNDNESSLDETGSGRRRSVRGGHVRLNGDDAYEETTSSDKHMSSNIRSDDRQRAAARLLAASLPNERRMRLRSSLKKRRRGGGRPSSPMAPLSPSDAVPSLPQKKRPKNSLYT